MSSIGAVSAAAVNTSNNLAQQATQTSKRAENDGDEATESRAAAKSEASTAKRMLNVEA